jgi:nucleoside-diphosphate-sugar epimerase
MRLDLRQRAALNLKDKSIDVVLHLAAATRGPAGKQVEDTVMGTANLLSAVRDAGIRRLVGISSLAILDCRSAPPLSVIDERTPIADDMGVSNYAAAKIRQERLFVEFAQDVGNSCSILRPGLVYDQIRITPGHAGVVRTHVGILVRHRGEVPTVEVHSLATAIANAAEKALAGCEVMHVVDDHLPSQSVYIAALRRRGLLPTTTVTVDWRLLQAVFGLAATVLAWSGFEDRAPDVLQRKSFAVRLKPFRFSNSKAKRLLQWVPAGQFA